MNFKVKNLIDIIHRGSINFLILGFEPSFSKIRLELFKQPFKYYKIIFIF